MSITSEKHKELTEHRITKTKIYDYDQIICISQSAINRQLEYMHTLYEVLQKQDFCDEDGDMGLIDCALAAPQIQLKTGVTKQNAIYYIRVKTGTLRYYEGHGKNAKLTEVPIINWKLAFDVTLDVPGLERRRVPDFEKIINPNDFGSLQLLRYFGSARYSMAESEIKDYGIQVGYLMEEYLARLGNKPQDPEPHNFIHILPRIKDTNAFPLAPTIAPTSLNFQSLPFITEDARDGKDGIEEGKDNMLVYLQMTAAHRMPYNLLSVSANWVIPPVDNNSPEYDGTICLSKATFLDGWLLPKLAEFNTETTWVTTEAWWKQGNILSIASWGLKGHVGITAEDRQRDGRLNNVHWVHDTNSPEEKRHFTYERTMDEDKMEDDAGLWRVYMKGRTKNDLIIPEGFSESGKSVIEIGGRTEVEAYLHLDGIGELGKQICWVWNSWTVKLILDGVEDGQLKIRFDAFNAERGSNTDNFNRGMFDYLVGEIHGALSKRLEELFNSSWRFIFAGASDFLIDKVCFNREGDLLCQIYYKR